MESKMHPQGYGKKARDGGATSPAAFMAQRWGPAPRFAQRDFPFWKLTFSIASAIILAAGLIWTVIEVRARYELEALTRQLEAESQKQKAAIQQQAAQQAQLRRSSAGRSVSAAGQRPDAAATSIPYMPQGTHAMPVGTIACMYGYKAQRQSNGGWKQLVVQGKAQPCRTR